MDIIELLNEFGISENESKVYLSALQIGPSSILNLSKRTGFSRQVLYQTTDQLIARGLMSTTLRGKKRLFVSEPPDRLLQYAKRRKEDVDAKYTSLKRALPSLGRAEGGKPSHRVYEGKKGVQAVIEQITLDQPNEIFEISDVEALHELFSPSELSSLRKTALKNKPKFLGIYTDCEESGQPVDRVSLPWEYRDFKANIVAYNDKVILIAFEDKIHSLIVESPHLAETLKILFIFAHKWLKTNRKE